VASIDGGGVDGGGVDGGGVDGGSGGSSNGGGVSHLISILVKLNEDGRGSFSCSSGRIIAVIGGNLW
jgi:hypothetical protein